MKLQVIRLFRHQVSATKVAEIQPGIYDVPGDISLEVADKIRKFGKAKVIVEKKAPENKLGRASKSKKKVAKPAVRSRRTGPEFKP